MINFYKKRGETPLEALSRLRQEQSELKEEVLSYAGRLDPMAEGILPVLVGSEENKNRQQYLGKDKEYSVTFLIGISSDTGDILGLINKVDFSFIEKESIENALYDLLEKQTQVYPWYSSQPVKGIPLFEYARKGDFSIERPSKNISIYSISSVCFEEKNIHDYIEEYIESIKKVTGDFRQEKIIKGWEELYRYGDIKCITVSCTMQVSSGTYIRGLCEDIESKINRPVLVDRLIRTKIF